MSTYLCSRAPKGENSKRIDNYGEFIQIFREFADRETDEVLRFEFSKRYFVEVAHSSGQGFFLNCVQENHFFDTLVPYDGEKTGFTIEEFLDDFWHHRVRQIYNFDEVVEIRRPEFIAKFRFPIRVFIPVLWFAAPFVFSWIDNRPMNAQTVQKVELFVLIVTSPYWLLVFQHLLYSWNATLSISSKEKLIVLKKGNAETAIRFSEITRVKIIRNRPNPFIGQWGYMRIVAGPKDRIIVSDLLCEELERIANVMNKEAIDEPSFYPLIRLKTKSAKDVAEETLDRQEKTNEFISKWSSKSKEELQRIAESKEEYADYAVDAAKHLLKMRK